MFLIFCCRCSLKMLSQRARFAITLLMSTHCCSLLTSVPSDASEIVKGNTYRILELVLYVSHFFLDLASRVTTDYNCSIVPDKERVFWCFTYPQGARCSRSDTSYQMALHHCSCLRRRQNPHGRSIAKCTRVSSNVPMIL